MSDNGYTYYVPDPRHPGRQYDASKGNHKPPQASRRPDDRAVGPRSTGVATSKQRAANLHGLSARQVQRLLRAKGYNLPLDGKMGPQTQAAIDSYINGKSPNQHNAWAARHFGPKPTATGRGGLAGKLLSAAANVRGGGGGSKGGGKNAKAPVDPIGQLVNGLLRDANGIGTMIPTDFADDVAGAQYDADISMLQRELDLAPNQEAQNIHDIDSYYGKVLAAQDEARKADTAANDAGVASVGDAVKAIVSSLGGEANEGSAPVADEGKDAVGTLAALGSAQDFYNNQMRPLLEQESAEQKTLSKARSSARRDELLANLLGLKKARGAAKGAAMIDIIGRNNDLAQTRFGNRASLVNTLGALSTAASDAESRALDNALKKAKLGQGPTPISPSQMRGVSGQALSQFLDDEGHIDKKTLSQLGVKGAVRAVNNAFLSAGLDLGNPQVAQSAMGVLRQLGITPDPRWYGLG